MNFEKQTTDEFLLECIRQNHGLLRDTKMEEELEERIFQRKIENGFYDDYTKKNINIIKEESNEWELERNEN